MKKLINITRIFIIVLVIIFCFFSCRSDSGNTDPVENNTVEEKTILNVPYGNDSQQVYDLYLPKNRNANTPTILMIHGGAWKAGQKEDFNYYIDLIKSKWDNVAIVNMNYRLASNSKNIHHNEIMADIDAVVAAVNQNASNYQISTKMGIIGTSAGGQLAMIYAYKYNHNIKCIGNFFGPSIISDWSWYNSTNLLGYVGNILTEYVGQSWNNTVYDSVSPYWNVTLNSQPTIIFHGSVDPIVPVYQSQWMNSKLGNLGVPREYYEYPAFHGLDDAQSNDAINKLVAFFKIYLQ